MTFAQLSARLKNFLGGWLLVSGIKEGLVECATVCVKSVVILINMQHLLSFFVGSRSQCLNGEELCYRNVVRRYL